MTESKFRENFIVQREELAYRVNEVNLRQVDTKNLLDTWPPIKEQMERRVVPFLIEWTARLNKESSQISLHRFEASHRRLIWLGQRFWWHPHLMQIRVRNMRLWLVAYQSEIAQIAGILVFLAVAGVLATFLLTNLDRIIAVVRLMLENIL